MLALANVFVGDPELHTGLVLYGLAPCIAMVIIFTYLAKGNDADGARLRGPQLGHPDAAHPGLRAAAHRGRRVRRVGGRRERRPLPGPAAGARRADPIPRRAARRRGGDGPAQAGPQRDVDPGPAVHAHRDVRAQGRPHPAAPGHRPRDGHPDDPVLPDHVLRRSCSSAGACASRTATPSRSPSTRPGATSRSPSPSRSPRSRRRSRWRPSSGRSSRSR